MKIYISLPISTPGYDILIQRRKARKWQRYFEVLGHEVVNPFDIGDVLEQFHKDCGKKPPAWSEYMAEDISNLIPCDRIFLCDGWTESKGCIQEAEIASQYFDIKVMFEKDIT